MVCQVKAAKEYISKSNAPDVMKSKAIALIDALSCVETYVAAFPQGDTGHNNATYITMAVVEAAVLGKKSVAGNDHKMANTWLKAITEN